MTNINEIELQRQLYGAATQFSEQLIKEFNLHPENLKVWFAEGGLLSQHLMIAWKVWLLEEMVMQDRAEWPANWWEAFKERWFPAWLKKRYPVRYEGIEWDCRFVYPSLPAKPNYKVAKSRGISFARPDEHIPG